MKTLSFIIIFTLGVFRLSISQEINKIQDSTLIRPLLRAASSTVELPQIVQPLPISAIYQRYAATPPNLSTGTVNINIPLYTLKVNDFELPFSLNYQTSGIKLTDPYLPLGYGWIFMPGLRISRVIMGNADDKTPRSIRTESELEPDIENNFLYLKSLLINGPSAGNIVPTDAQYDIFSIYLQDINVRFIMYKEGNNWTPLTIGSAVKITPILSSSGEFNGFEVKDERGIIYQFGETASYTPPYQNPQATTYIELNSKGKSTWLLRKIILPGQNNSISFNWNAGIYGSNNPINDMYVIKDYLRYGYGSVQYEIPEFPNWQYDASGGVVNPYPCMYLKDIQFSFGKIEITYDADNMMKTMKVYSNDNGNYTIIKNIDFNTSNVYQNWLLRGVTIGQDAYKFEYEESNPFINLNAMDWWGYYNGRTNVIDIPQISFLLTRSLNAGDDYPATIGGADRSANSISMQENILKKIVYPTGGYSKYEYDVHKFNGSVFKEGGGLRVKKIITKESDTAPELITEYRYGNNESGLGICTKEPVTSSFFSELAHFYDSAPPTFGSYSYTYRQLNLFADSKIHGYTSFNPNVWYDVVTEYSSEGKTIYRFEYTQDDSFFLLNHTVPINPIDQTAPLISCFRNLFNQGPRLRYKEIYKKESSSNYQKLLEEETQYATINGQDYFTPGGYGYLTGLYVERKCCYDNYPDGIYDYSGIPFPGGTKSNFFVYKNYRIMIETQKIVALLKKYFDLTTGDIVQQRTDYTYVIHNGVINLASETSTTSSNTTFSKQMLYPLDNLSMLTQEQKTAAGRMVELNLLATPLVEKETLGNSSTIKINQYKDWGNNLLLPEKLYLQTGNGIQENRITYQNYDSKGNPLYLSKDEADKVVYIWGYSYQYPIAKIENATYDEMKSALGYTSDAQVESLSAQSNPDVNLIDSKLRAYFKDKISFVTTYTYKPLVGMTSATDPQGITTYYDYDSFGRLKETYYYENNDPSKKRTVESYDYHYKN